MNLIGKSVLMVKSRSDYQVVEFCNKLREERNRLHFSQTKCAQLVGITQPQWSALESCEYEPMPSLVFEIEKKFGLDAGELSLTLGYIKKHNEYQASTENLILEWISIK